MMTQDQIELELNKMVQELHLACPEVEAEQSGRWIHVSISSESFRGKSPSERDNLIWREFEKRFDDETILSITQCYLLTPEQRQTAVPA